MRVLATHHLHTCLLEAQDARQPGWQTAWLAAVYTQVPNALPDRNVEHMCHTCVCTVSIACLLRHPLGRVARGANRLLGP